MSSFRAICEERKQELNISTAEIAEKADLSVSTVSNYFNGRMKQPSLHTAAMICRVLGVSIDQYYEITPTEEPHTEEPQIEDIAMLKHGLKIRNYIIIGMLSFFLILLVFSVVFHLVAYTN